ncbi:imaginal disc development protein B4 [Haematobia irritans]|uniref:imaginal disc development protein B4 n=1 Tax=Haematobia irritans TaxID=7368 RepID=UPI003F4FD648
MTDFLKLAEMQRTNIEIERQRHLANWLIKSSPHMATPQTAVSQNSSSTAAASTTAITTATSSLTPFNGAAVTTSANAITQNNLNSSGHSLAANNTTSSTNCHHSSYPAQPQYNSKHSSSTCVNTSNNSATNPVFYLMANNGNNGVATGASASNMSSNSKLSNGAYKGPHHPAAAHHPRSQHGLHHLAEGRKAKLRRFNSHDTSSNMFSVADFEYARLARRNEIELKQRLQRRTRHGYSGSGSGLSSCAANGVGSQTSNVSGDYSTGDSKTSKNSNESQNDPLPVEEFLERYSLPRVVRISYKTPFSNETLQSSSSNNSSTITSTSSVSGDGKAIAASAGAPIEANIISSNSNSNTGTSSSSASSSGGGNTAVQTLASNSSSNTSASKNAANETNQNTGHANHQLADDNEQGELFLLYRLVRERNIYHGHNTKTTAASRKKGVLIPQEFPGYFSLLNDKGMPTATLYTSLVQLVRERVCKFVSVDNMPAFMESQTNGRTDNSPTEGCLNIYSSNTNNNHNRPHYVKTTARGGQVFKLLAVYEDGKQDHSTLTPTITCGGLGASKQNSNHGREKERSRYAQLLNEQRQTLYVSLSTKGKFYEIEPGIPQILQKRLEMSTDGFQRKLNTDCVHRITALMTPSRELPLSLKYISGPNGSTNAIPENICITRISKENIIIACPIEDVEIQSPLHLRKLHLTKEMNLVKNTLGFENEQRMLANPNVQNILKFCQFNCDQFLKMVEVEVLQRSERSTSKSRGEGLKILKPLHLPKLLRREKTTIPAHEKEDSIIFLSKSDLANMESKEQRTFDDHSNRITEKMKVFQSTKKKWFRKQDKNAGKSLTSIDIDVHAKKMSMERYSDMSKLLQERFGDKSTEQECISEPSGCQSDVGCSDTETTTLTTIDEHLKRFGRSKMGEPIVLQKSMSLQDIELIGRQSRKPDLLPTHHTTDTISESGTDIEDLENREPLQTSFITEKLYNEFHVKTKQYSKSSSSLHQLLNFSLPQKLHIGENKKSLAQLKNQMGSKAGDKRLDFNVGEPITGRRAAGGLSLLGHNSNSQNTSMMLPLSPTSFIEDDLPYSSVRDSLILSSDEGSPPDIQADTMGHTLNFLDYTKENIYAEICHEASAMGGIPSSQTRDTFSGATHSTQISDDFGDYASLTYPQPMANTNGLGNAISRVQITCSESPISYHTVYLGNEPLGERYCVGATGDKERPKAKPRQSRDSSHVTTVDVASGGDVVAIRASNALNTSQSDSGGLDNIYNTLK